MVLGSRVVDCKNGGKVSAEKEERRRERERESILLVADRLLTDNNNSLTWSANAMVEALGLGAKAIVRIAIAATPNERGALAGGGFVAPLVDVLLAWPGITGSSAAFILLLFWCLQQRRVVRAASSSSSAASSTAAGTGTQCVATGIQLLV